MSTNWELLATGELIGTAYCGPNKTLAFQWDMSLSHLQLFDPHLKVQSDDGKERELGELLEEMQARPIQKYGG